MDARQASPRRGTGHETRPLRGRLRGHGRRHPRRRRSALGRGGSVLAPMGCACRKRRRGSATSTRGSTSWGGASSAAPGEAEPASGVYTYPSKKALASIKDKVRTLTRRAKHRTLADLLRRLNPVLRGWCNYFRHGVSKADLRLRRPLRLLARRRLAPQATPRTEHAHPGPPLPPGWEISDGGIDMFRPEAVAMLSATATGAPRSRPHGRANDTGSPAPAA
jgi:RNA-directed DNA polymerase